ncbi:polymer-forming cytoskeletal protein [Marinobacter lutaoensis]|jgi:cytoskeletal protein CcmA (bactofilin family)|uniref:Cell shape determination protein CcmA n=1 Tax=Marinobacter lutaoensis TaxID=135739 RepID=A0A1V2DPF5_9GAMM|nr:polymer-forming cytoskeletal protein [Marinobacter lutaoensis]MBE02518.1 cell shape determination protein CcmA [Marinobacter sp.]MBI43539.1 cell shape determination protein CcmA [Oceanospirillales bacterium]NVD36084.1 polymer-forming cytoskeletal protein [Marinobacter lutaoensis]ONF42380.1 cell shape determination protein CcmA [Marinobacter lutaoensis]|tara:strand:+ start:4770 stop:5231 length:462 start_codon:yes stop_codon:yes gene_type:complete
MLGKKKQKTRRTTGHFDTLISSRTSVAGDINFSGGLHIDGRVRGRVVAEEGSDAVLRLSEVGEITGDIVAPHVIINGTVNGDVYASAHLELAEKAAINGNVYYNLIEMAMGATVNGNLVHQKEPVGLLGKDSPKVPEPATDKAGEGAGEAGAQ